MSGVPWISKNGVSISAPGPGDAADRSPGDPSPYEGEHPARYDELVAACAAVSSPKAAVVAPVWRSAIGDVPPPHDARWEQAVTVELAAFPLHRRLPGGTTIDVTMLRREQERIAGEVRAIEARQATLDASLEHWEEVMDLAFRLSTRCATAYRRAGDRTRRQLNAAVLDQVHVRDGHVVDATYKEPFDLLCSSSKFEYGDVVGREGFEPP